MCLENPSVQFYFRTGLATLSMPFRVLAGGALANHMKLTPGGRWAFSAQVRLRPKFKNGIFFGILNRKSGLQILVSHFSAERTRVSPLSHSVAHYRIKHQQNGSKERFCPFLLYINAFAKPPISMLSSHLGASFMD